MDEKSFDVKVTGYYPSDDPIEGGFKDCAGNPLKTLSDYERGSDDNSYVSLAVDKKLIKLGSLINIEGFNDNDGVPILFYACDVGGEVKGYHVDICCGDEDETYSVDSGKDKKKLTIIGFQKLNK